MPEEASAANRRTPLLAGKPRRRIGEVAGGTAAECAAVWCCCPCAAVNVLVLALYRLPAGLWRRACRRRKRRGGGGASRLRRLDGSSGPCGGPRGSAGGCGTTIEELERRLADADVASGWDEEDEVWARFYGAGFWRSPSQRDSDS